MDQAHASTDKKLKKLEKEITKEYETALKELQKKLEDYMRRFDVKNEIKLKQVENGKLSQEAYDKWRYGQLCVGQRWREMVETMAEDLTNADKIAMSMVNGFTPEVYALNHNFGTFEAEVGSGIDTSYTLYDRDTVEYLMKKNPDLLPKPTVDIAKDVAWNKKHIVSAITQGVLQGESIPKIAKRLQRVADMDRKAAIRNARTATTGAENAGRSASYQRAKDLGIQMKQVWMATLDNRTRHTHRQLDGEKISVGDKWHPQKFSNGCRYPGDPQGRPEEVYNCRCTLIAEVEGDNIDLSNLSERNTRHLGGLTYDEWKDDHKQFGTEKVDQAPDTFAGKIQKIKERCNRKGSIDENDLLEAGKIISEERKAGLNRLVKEQKQAKKRVDETYANVKRIMNDKNSTPGDKDAALAAYHDAHGAWRKLSEATEGSGSAGALKDVLSQVRQMGTPPDVNLKHHLFDSRSTAAKSVINAYNYYPTDWIRRSVDLGRLRPKKVERGYYDHWGMIIAISGNGGEGSFKTAIHELGHRFERCVPNATNVEAEFYARRTEGEKLTWLGPGYCKSEVTRLDKFLNPYMGKYYGGQAYELISMGFEYAYTDPLKLAQDPDMEAWIYGILSLM